MRLAIVAVGRLKAGPERELVERYVERAQGIGRALGVSGPDVIEIPESRARREADRRAEEAQALLERSADGARIALDERARSLPSEDFAARLAAFRDGGTRRLSFLVGGPDGLDPRARAACDLSLSFGALTLPHQIVRILLAEQAYRALTILSGHPYHRAGDEGA